MYDAWIEKNHFTKNIFKLVSFFVTTILIVILFYVIKSGVLQDNDAFVAKIKNFGVLAPVLFLLLQFAQVVFPMIPGGSSCLIGVLAFGPVFGFFYNYLGVVGGSVLAYFLSKRYGLKLIRMFFKEETIEKYIGYITNQTFRKIFLVGILLPGLPDDLLCYMAGISGIRFSTFLGSILIGKTFSMVMYSFLISFFV